MIRVAFFWVGDDTSVPQLYINSIRLFHKNNIEIIQLSDLRTSKIKGVDRILKANLSSDLMVARLQAYCMLELIDDYTLFTDADCILIKPLILPYTEDILLLQRVDNFLINSNYPEHYPEFDGKMISAVMPFLFGAICIRNSENNSFFDTLLTILKKLPTRFHRWYGDQFALKVAVDNRIFKYGFLDSEIHLKIMNFVPTELDIIIMRSYGTQLITFKGSSTQDDLSIDKVTLLELTLDNLKKLI